MMPRFVVLFVSLLVLAGLHGSAFVAKSQLARESADLHFGIVARGKDIAELKTEIERLEKETGETAAVEQPK